MPEICQSSSALDKGRGREMIKKHRHAKRARVIFFCDRNIHRTVVYNNDLVKFFWLRCTARKTLGIYDVHTMLHR